MELVDTAAILTVSGTVAFDDLRWGAWQIVRVHFADGSTLNVLATEDVLAIERDPSDKLVAPPVDPERMTPWQVMAEIVKRGRQALLDPGLGTADWSPLGYADSRFVTVEVETDPFCFPPLTPPGYDDVQHT